MEECVYVYNSTKLFDNLLNSFIFQYCLLITDSCYINISLLENFKLNGNSKKIGP